MRSMGLDTTRTCLVPPRSKGQGNAGPTYAIRLLSHIFTCVRSPQPLSPLIILPSFPPSLPRDTFFLLPSSQKLEQIIEMTPPLQWRVYNQASSKPISTAPSSCVFVFGELEPISGQFQTEGTLVLYRMRTVVKGLGSLACITVWASSNISSYWHRSGSTSKLCFLRTVGLSEWTMCRSRVEYACILCHSCVHLPVARVHLSPIYIRSD